jgi:hypothetical protein
MPIAMQLHGEHIPVKRTQATEGRPVLSNGTINTLT